MATGPVPTPTQNRCVAPQSTTPRPGSVPAEGRCRPGGDPRPRGLLLAFPGWGAVLSVQPPARTWWAGRTASACLGPGGPEPSEGVRQGESLESCGGANGPVMAGPSRGHAQMLVSPSYYLLTPSCCEATGSRWTLISKWARADRSVLVGLSAWCRVRKGRAGAGLPAPAEAGFLSTVTCCWRLLYLHLTRLPPWFSRAPTVCRWLCAGSALSAFSSQLCPDRAPGHHRLWDEGVPICVLCPGSSP